MNSLKWFGVTVVVVMTAATCGSAWAVPTIDGNASVGDGYASLSTQNTNTHFANAGTGDAINGGGGSEIDQIFAKVESGRLYVVIAGNLETNFNKLDVFIDSEAGGQNTLDGSTLPAGVDPFCPPCAAPGGALQQMAGGADGLGLEKITFDTGFDADYYLTFTHGFEKLSPGLPAELAFYAATAHYAELNNGTGGRNVSAGMQLAQRGLPQVLRGTTADFDTDGTVDGGEFLTWQQNLGALGVTRKEGDATGDLNVLADDLAAWETDFGYDVANSSLAGFPFAPQSAGIDNSEALLGPALLGSLSQGDLIDKNYALGDGGCNADNSGADCSAMELEFALDVDVINDPANTKSHRNMDNVIDLQMAFDNSNTVGVSDDVGVMGDYSDPTLEDPSVVTSGIEFSIPLSEIGSPSGTNIRITAFVNGGSHDFLSNQVSGVGILQENIGPPGFADFSDGVLFPGDQFVTLAVPLSGLTGEAVPEPSTLVLVCLGTLACGCVGCRRNRKQ